MHRAVATLLLPLIVVLVILPAPTAGAAPAVLNQPTYTCSASSAVMRFSWQLAEGATLQYLDVSLADNGFAPGTFINAGPFDDKVTSYLWAGIRPHVRHYYRLNTLTPSGWQSAAGTFSAPCRPGEATVGGSDAPFALYAGIYLLDLANGSIRCLIDTRNRIPYLSNEPTMAWAKDGTALAVASIWDGVRVYDTGRSSEKRDPQQRIQRRLA